MRCNDVLYDVLYLGVGVTRGVMSTVLPRCSGGAVEVLRARRRTSADRRLAQAGSASPRRTSVACQASGIPTRQHPGGDEAGQAAGEAAPHPPLTVMDFLHVQAVLQVRQAARWVKRVMLGRVRRRMRRAMKQIPHTWTAEQQETMWPKTPAAAAAHCAGPACLRNEGHHPHPPRTTHHTRTLPHRWRLHLD